MGSRRVRSFYLTTHLLDRLSPVSSKSKSYSHFFSKNISVYTIFNDQSFNDTLTKYIVSFEQLGSGLLPQCCLLDTLSSTALSH